MDADLVALREEIDARLGEVERSRGTCIGHYALARAIATLLRCQRAQLNQRAANTVAADSSNPTRMAFMLMSISTAPASADG